MSKKKYRNRYCLFLDILGFKEIVEDSVRPSKGSRSQTATERIYFHLKKIAESLKYRLVIAGKAGKFTKSSKRVTQFSDSVVVSYVAKEVGGLSGMLYDVLRLQMTLVQRGLLVRGAITRGKLHHDRDFVFGPALNEASELERLAMYPRVVIAQDLLVDAGIIKPTRSSAASSSRNPASIVAKDLDGMFFVNYFNVLLEDFDDDWSELAEYLISLRELIRKIANAKQPSLRLKHSWLRQKFNDVAEPLEKSGYGIWGGKSVPSGEEDHFVNVAPFR